MYKVMIVDDEWLVREGLRRTIPWERLHCQVVADADNGEDALKLLKSVKPDIVLSDIRMPGMDGLELVQRINDNRLGIETIFLTGFDDFAYARQAVKLGAVDILLKPSNPAELQRAFQEATEKLNKRQRQVRYHKDLEQRLQSVRPLVLEQMLGRLLLGEADTHDMNMMYEKLEGNLEPFEQYRIVALQRRGSATAERRPWDNFSLEQSACCALLKPDLLPVQARPERGLLAVLLRDDGDRQWERIFPQLVRTAGENGERLGVSRVHGGILSASQAYAEAYAALLHHDMPGMEAVLQYSQLAAAAEGGPEWSEEALVETIKWGARDNLRDIIQAGYRLALLQLGPDGVQRHRAITQLAFGVYNALTRRFPEIAGLPEMEQFLAQLNAKIRLVGEEGAKDGGGALCWLEELAADAQRRYARSKRSKGELDEVLEQLKLSYAEELLMSQFAADLHMSDSKFSKLFKKRTGKSFVEYVTDLRMAKAKDLLLDPQMRVSDVATLVGYTDQRYFSQQFKRTTGKTPQSFREKLIKT